MITQKFKGDSDELKVEAALSPATNIISDSLDQFFSSGYDANPFLLMLYDQDRIPFKSRVPRDSFLAFFREMLNRFPFTGSFETYIFLIKAIFGDGSSVLFSIPSPGKLQMLVNAAASLQFNFVASEFNGSDFVISNMLSIDGSQIVFNGVSGIDSEYKLTQLLGEIYPAGIFPALTLAFFTLSEWIDHAGNAIIDNLGNQIIFFETGGP